MHTFKINYLKISIILFSLLMYRCGPKFEKYQYHGISLDKIDTASLTINFSKDEFYGDYVTRYNNGRFIENGTIRGHIKGDSLIGKYNYLSKDNVRSTRPIALLRDGKNLKLGKGKTGTFLGLNVYEPGSIYFDDSLVIFKPTIE